MSAGLFSGGQPGAVLVTGAGVRLGAAIAEHLAARGWSVCIHCRHSVTEAQKLADRLASSYGVGTALVSADLADVAAVQTLHSRAEQALGRPIRAIVNNASSFEYDDLAQLQPEQFELTLRVNLLAPLLLVQALAVDAQLGGCVVNLLDQKIYNLNPDFFSYTVAKQALAATTGLLARACAPVRVCGVAPGITLPSADQTAEEFARAHGCTPLGRSSTTADVASAVAFVLDNPAITGQVITVDGGQHLVPLPRDVMFLTRV